MIFNSFLVNPRLSSSPPLYSLWEKTCQGSVSVLLASYYLDSVVIRIVIQSSLSVTIQINDWVEFTTDFFLKMCHGFIILSMSQSFSLLLVAVFIHHSWSTCQRIWGHLQEADNAKLQQSGRYRCVFGTWVLSPLSSSKLFLAFPVVLFPLMSRATFCSNVGGVPNKSPTMSISSVLSPPSCPRAYRWFALPS